MSQRKSGHVVERDSWGRVWVKSTRSNGPHTSCVEVSREKTVVLVRHSRNRTGARLSFATASWDNFLLVIAHAAMA